jgi:hypothetical protein
MRQDSTQEIRIPAPNGRPPAHLIRGIWGREYNSGRVEWFALRSDVRQAHKRQIFRAACMTLQDARQDAAQALSTAAALRRLLTQQEGQQ